MKPQKSTNETNGFSLICLFLMICLAFGSSCRRNSGNEKRYELKGKVVAVEKEKALVTISHEAVKGLMPAMTMPFKVPSESDLQILAPDDQVTATLVVDGSHSWLEELIITRESANPSGMPAAIFAKEGDEVPNFTQIDRELGKDQELYAKTHLLSISIDPEYDTPKVLRSYGAAHTERYQNE